MVIGMVLLSIILIYVTPQLKDSLLQLKPNIRVRPYDPRQRQQQQQQQRLMTVLPPHLRY